MDAELGAAVDRLLKLNRALRESPSDRTLRELVDALDRFLSRPEFRWGVEACAGCGPRPRPAAGKSPPFAG